MDRGIFCDDTCRYVDLEFIKINVISHGSAVGADVVYPVGNLQIASNFDQDSQSLAGGIFNVATRVSGGSFEELPLNQFQIGTSLGLAITSSIATSVSSKYHAANPSLLADSPEVLMVGFRAAGWTCFAAALLSFIIALVGLRGIGIVGQKSRIISGTDSGISLPEMKVDV